MAGKPSLSRCRQVSQSQRQRAMNDTDTNPRAPNPQTDVLCGCRGSSGGEPRKPQRCPRKAMPDMCPNQPSLACLSPQDCRRRWSRPQRGVCTSSRFPVSKTETSNQQQCPTLCPTQLRPVRLLLQGGQRRRRRPPSAARVWAAGPPRKQTPASAPCARQGATRRRPSGPTAWSVPG